MRDLTNQRFGRQIAIKPCGKNKYGNVLWLCKCDCGNEHIVASGKLIQGKSKSCGCYALEVKTKSLEKHGITTGGKPRTFTIWNGMKARCYNPKSASYKNYGARGIAICDSWLTFENFHNWAINNGYADDLEIDRIDNNSNYCPENCRWVNAKTQCNNKSTCVFIKYKNYIYTIEQWTEIVGLSRSTLLHRLERGWGVDDALRTPTGAWYAKGLNKIDITIPKEYEEYNKYDEYMKYKNLNIRYSDD